MTTDIHIPPEALEAGAIVIALADEDTPFGDTARAAFLAMIEAWPRVTGVHASRISPAVLILPLTTKEPGND